MVLRYAEPDYSDEHDQDTKEMAAGQANIVTPGNLAPRLVRGKTAPRGRRCHPLSLVLPALSALQVA